MNKQEIQNINVGIAIGTGIGTGIGLTLNPSGWDTASPPTVI